MRNETPRPNNFSICFFFCMEFVFSDVSTIWPFVGWFVECTHTNTHTLFQYLIWFYLYFFFFGSSSVFIAMNSSDCHICDRLCRSVRCDWMYTSLLASVLVTIVRFNWMERENDDAHNMMNDDDDDYFCLAVDAVPLAQAHYTTHVVRI